MLFSSVLNCVGVNSQLMDLAKQNGVTVFVSKYFGVQVPALGVRLVITAERSVLARRHLQSATGTDSFLHERKILDRRRGAHCDLSVLSLEATRIHPFLCEIINR